MKRNFTLPANKELGDDIFEDFRPKTQWEIQDENEYDADLEADYYEE